MTPEHRLVVALSGRDEDAALLRYANALTELNGGARRLPTASRGRRTARPATAAPVVVDQGDGLVVAAPQAVEYVKVSSGRALDRLRALAADPETEAVLVGEAVGRRQLRALVRQAACSVWFVPDGAAPEVGRILVPVDFSVRAADCLRVATVLARLSAAAECLALHVYFDESVLPSPERDQALRAQVSAAYARFLEPIDTLKVRVTPLFQEAAGVARVINRTAAEQDADLVILASRGRTWAGALLHESVAEQTLRECRVPLLVVKHFGARLGLWRVLREPAFSRRHDLRFN
jgi:nucleotide-binding universal stress UspA family protein